MKCQKCGSNQPDGQAFCDQCGNRLVVKPAVVMPQQQAGGIRPPVDANSIRCLNCGNANPPDSRFCELCGTPVGPQGMPSRPPAESALPPTQPLQMPSQPPHPVPAWEDQLPTIHMPPPSKVGSELPPTQPLQPQREAQPFTPSPLQPPVAPAGSALPPTQPLQPQREAQPFQSNQPSTGQQPYQPPPQVRQPAPTQRVERPPARPASGIPPTQVVGGGAGQGHPMTEQFQTPGDGFAPGMPPASGGAGMTQRYQAFAGPMLMLIADNGVAITLSSGQNAWVIGRLDPVSNSLPDVDLTPVDPEYTSSRRHAQLSLNGDQAYLTSLTRTNWTKVNGQRLIADQPTPIQSGDRLEFGKVTVTFRQ